MNKLQTFLESHLGPLAEKLNKSDIIRTISMGMMSTMPITLGVAILAILVYLPIPAWQALISGAGIQEIGVQVLTVTLNMLAPYEVIALARAYATIKNSNVINSIIVALGAFFVLCPLNIIEGTYSNSYTISTSYLGSNGLFLAMILGILIPSIYRFLMKHVGIKLPDSIPPMVTDSLSPTFAAMIIFAGAFLIKWGFSLTAFGNLFDFFNSVVAAPVMKLGCSVPALLIAYTFSNLLWFFGIHPSAILSAYGAAIGVAVAGNVQAYMSGQPLPYLQFQLVYALLTMGGSGILIGLSLSMLTAKSERYKSLRNLGFLPSLFNISEPIMFGFPVVMNTIFFIPMVISVPLCGGVAWIMSSMGLGSSLNPAASMPWIMPGPITAFLQGGFSYLLIAVVVVLISTILYFPFFKMADNEALNEESKGE